MKKLLSILMIGLFIIACSNEEDTNTSDEFYGNWSWTETTGGISGGSETPESTGDSSMLVITANVIKKYINGNLESEQSYYIETGASIFGGEREMVIYENGSKQSYILNGKQLSLFDECYDCYQHNYIKE